MAEDKYSYKLYKNLEAAYGADNLPDFNTFESKMTNDSVYRDKVYKNAVSAYGQDNLPDYITFESNLGLKKKDGTVSSPNSFDSELLSPSTSSDPLLRERPVDQFIPEALGGKGKASEPKPWEKTPDDSDKYLSQNRDAYEESLLVKTNDENQSSIKNHVGNNPQEEEIYRGGLERQAENSFLNKQENQELELDRELFQLSKLAKDFPEDEAIQNQFAQAQLNYNDVYKNRFKEIDNFISDIDN